MKGSNKSRWAIAAGIIVVALAAAWYWHSQSANTAAPAGATSQTQRPTGGGRHGMRGGALAQLDNTRRTGHGYDERISLLGPQGVIESGSQASRGVTLWQGARCIQPGLHPDWFSRVEGSYYAHLDAFVRSLGGEAVPDLPGLLDGLRAQAIAEAAVLSLRQGQFVSVEPLA